MEGALELYERLARRQTVWVLLLFVTLLSLVSFIGRGLLPVGASPEFTAKQFFALQAVGTTTRYGWEDHTRARYQIAEVGQDPEKPENAWAIGTIWHPVEAMGEEIVALRMARIAPKVFTTDIEGTDKTIAYLKEPIFVQMRDQGFTWRITQVWPLNPSAQPMVHAMDAENLQVETETVPGDWDMTRNLVRNLSAPIYDFASWWAIIFLGCIALVSERLVVALSLGGIASVITVISISRPLLFTWFFGVGT